MPRLAPGGGTARTRGAGGILKPKEEEHLHPFFHFRQIEKIIFLVITGIVLIKCLFYPNALDVLILAGLLILVILATNGKKF